MAEKYRNVLKKPLEKNRESAGNTAEQRGIGFFQNHESVKSADIETADIGDPLYMTKQKSVPIILRDQIFN